MIERLKCFPASDNFCRLLIIFENRFKQFDTLMIFLKEFFEKVHFGKIQQMIKKNHAKL